ncbi:MAG: hypothetical protein H7Y28_16290 [Rhodoferax sp.]|nr:hypothetical protein [Rhodoferax sp.]
MFKKSFSVVAVAAFVTACGGGGGGSASGNTPGGPVALAIDSSNYTMASQEAVSSSFFVSDTSTLLTGAQVEASRSPVNFALAQVPHVNQWFAAAPQLLVGAVTEQTVNCPNGGTMTVKVQDANNNNKADSGDSITIIANQCKDGASTIGGSLDLKIKTLTGAFNTPPSKAEMSMTLTNLVSTTASGTTSGNGTINMTLDLPDNQHINSTLQVPSLSMTSTISGTTYTRSLENFSVSESVTSGLGGTSSSTSINGTITSTALGQKTITVSTLTPFKRTLPAAYPSSGQLVVSGANGSKARITAINATQALLELDANGDGTYEVTTTKSWSQLL